MHLKTRSLVGAFGTLMLLLGLGCLNYTKLGNVEHHREVALQRGWPAPSRAIHSVGMLLSVLGAGVIGFVAGRRKRSGSQEDSVAHRDGTW